MTYSICYCCVAALVTVLLSYKDAKHSQSHEAIRLQQFKLFAGLVER